MAHPFVRVLLLAASASSLLVAEDGKPIWAKNAVRLDECYAAVQPQIPSPDGRSLIQLRCHPAKRRDDPVPYLVVRTSNGRWRDVALDEGAQEVLWSPDSKAFLVNGAYNSYSGYFTAIYALTEDAVQKINVTSSAQQDMVSTFPPCKAFNRDESDCQRIAKNPAFNMSGIAWAKGSSAIIVMAEVPCNSGYGGIMCAVQGYELTVPTGTIVRRMSAAELKKQWQTVMAWEMQVPEPAEYGPAQKH